MAKNSRRNRGVCITNSRNAEVYSAKRYRTLTRSSDRVRVWNGLKSSSVTGTTITSTRLGHSGEGLSVTKDTGRVPTGARDRHVGGGGVAAAAACRLARSSMRLEGWRPPAGRHCVQPASSTAADGRRGSSATSCSTSMSV